MEVQRPHRGWAAIGFMIVWTVLWASGIIVALYVFGGEVLSGDPVAALILLVWIGAAGFGLLSAARRLKALLMNAPRARKPWTGPHRWSDGYSDRLDP